MYDNLDNLRTLSLINMTSPPGSAETIQLENQHAYRMYAYVISDEFETCLIEEVGVSSSQAKYIIDFLAAKAYK